MAKYKVSYKVLSEQGNELKKLAKLVSTYSEKVNSVRGKLGEDQMLAEVRNNLQKFAQQMEETRAVLNLAGELLSKSVESYARTETSGVKKIDNTKAHKRDFYKQPVVVASAGGAAAAGGASVAAGSAAPTSTTTTTNITYNETTNVTYNEAPVATPVSTYDEVIPVSVQPEATVSATPAAAPTAAPSVGTSSSAGVGVAAALGGLAAGAGAAVGASHLAKNKKNQNEENQASSDDYDPEAALAEAMERVRQLEEDA